MTTASAMLSTRDAVWLVRTRVLRSDWSSCAGDPAIEAWPPPAGDPGCPSSPFRSPPGSSCRPFPGLAVWDRRRSESGFEDGFVEEVIVAPPSHHLADLLAERVLDDPQPIRLAAEERLAELDRLVGRDLRRERRLQRIDDGLDEDRAGHRQGAGDELVAGRRVLDRNPGATAGLGDLREVDRLELDAVLGIAEEDHLLPFDLAQRVVLDDDDLDRQAVLDRGREVGHEHAEAAIADEGDDLPAGVSRLGADRVRQTAGHRREVPGE